MTTLQLDAHGSCTLDSSGNGSVNLGPTSTRTYWDVTTVAVQGTSVNPIPTASVFLGSTNLGSTWSGTLDSDNVDVRVWPGQQLTVKWSGGTPGASATAYAYGTVGTIGGAA